VQSGDRLCREDRAAVAALQPTQILDRALAQSCHVDRVAARFAHVAEELRIPTGRAHLSAFCALADAIADVRLRAKRNNLASQPFGIPAATPSAIALWTYGAATTD
jgi:hypothetical protein